MSKNIKLIELRCNCSSITSLDLSKNQELQIAEIRMNKIENLDVSGHSKLLKLDCSGTSFSMSTGIANGNLKTINLLGCTAVETFDCSLNSIEDLDLSSCTNLVDLNIRTVKTSSIDFKMFPKLVVLDCSETSYTSLDLSGNSLLEILNVGSLKLTSLDLSQLPNLSMFSYNSSSSLKERLDFSNNPKLYYLFLSEYPFSSLNLSENTNCSLIEIVNSPELKEIIIGTNQNIDTQSIPSHITIRRIGSFSIPINNYNVSSLGEEFDVEILASGDYSASSEDSWIHQVTTKAKTSFLSYRIDANTSNSSRTGNIKITTADGISENIKVYQPAGTVPDESWKSNDPYRRSLAMQFMATWSPFCPSTRANVTDASNALEGRIESLTMYDAESSSDLSFNAFSTFKKSFSVSSYPTCIVDSRAAILYAGELVDVSEETRTGYGVSSAISFTSSLESNNLTVDLSLCFKKSGDYLLNLFVVEDNVVNFQSTRSGDDNAYVHNSVARLALTSSLGEPISISNDLTVFNKRYTASLPTNLVAENCRVLAVVQKKSSNLISQNVAGADYTKYNGFYVDNCKSGKIGNNVPIEIETGNFGVYESTDFSSDGTWKQLQTASFGTGINIVLMGDGFTDRHIANGTYEAKMKQAADLLFALEPMKSFRNRFNLYYVNAVSKSQLISNSHSTAFDSFIGDMCGGNDEKVDLYAKKIPGLTDENMKNSIILVVQNSSLYGGTCYMYSMHASISYHPFGYNDEQFLKLVNHEAVGHGFGKLMDEYGGSGAITEERRNIYLNAYEPIGWGQILMLPMIQLQLSGFIS